MNKPLVIHVATADLGLRFLLLNQLKAIQSAGYRVIGISSDGPYRAEVEAAGIQVIPITMHRAITPLADLKALVQLVGMFRRLRPTIVHTHNPKPSLLGQVAAKIAGVPVIINTLHGFYFHDHSPPRQRRFYIAMETIAARCSDVILSQNREDMRTAVLEGICPASLIQFLGNGIDVCRFDRAHLNPTQQTELRHALGIPSDAVVVGAVGRLVAEKGYHDLFAAVRDLKPTFPNLHVLIVGPAEPDKADGLTVHDAEQYGIHGWTHFTGLRRDMPELYGLMDILAHPSHREGFPRAPMEAAAMCLPVVACDIRGSREAVQHGKNGILVPVKDSAALAEALHKLLADAQLRNAMGHLGRNLAEREFDEQIIFGRVLATYKQLLAQKHIKL